MSEKQSIWKKEITFRRKPKEQKEKGVAVPPPAPPPARPDSVAELLRPIAPAEAASAPPRPLVSHPLSEPPLSAPPPPPPRVGPAPPAAAPAVPASASVPEAPPAPPPLPAPAPVEAPPEPAAAKEAKPAKVPRKERKRLERAHKLEVKREAEARKAAERARAKRAKGHKKHKRVVGLEVGSTQIAAARVVNNGRPKVVKLARQPLARGLVVGGELREPDALANELREFFKKHKLPKHGVRLGIANARIGLRIFELNGIAEPKQRHNAIRFRAQETLPIPIDKAVLDYRILDEGVDEKGESVCKVLLVVVDREPVDRFVGACKKAGIKLVGIDLEAFGLLRALAGPGSGVAFGEDAGAVVVAIGAERTIVAVSNGETCEYTRVLDWGGASLDVAAARALDLTPSEAEPVRLEVGLVGEGETATLDAARAERVRSALREELQAFARDLVAALRHYQEQPGSLGIGEIVVTGGVADCPGLAEELSRLMGVSVRVGDPLARVKAPRKLRKRAAPGSLAVAVGLGIED